MSTTRRLSAGRAALRGLCAIAMLATLLIDANATTPVSATASQAAGSDDQTPPVAGTAKDDQTPQAVETAKPGADGAPPSGKPAVDPNAPLPPADANADARELVKRRMQLCRLRPALCVQGADQRPTGDPAERDDPSRNK